MKTINVIFHKQKEREEREAEYYRELKSRRAFRRNVAIFAALAISRELLKNISINVKIDIIKKDIKGLKSTKGE